MIGSADHCAEVSDMVILPLARSVFVTVNAVVVFPPVIGAANVYPVRFWPVNVRSFEKVAPSAIVKFTPAGRSSTVTAMRHYVSFFRLCQSKK